MYRYNCICIYIYLLRTHSLSVSHIPSAQIVSVSFVALELTLSSSIRQLILCWNCGKGETSYTSREFTWTVSRLEAQGSRSGRLRSTGILRDWIGRFNWSRASFSGRMMSERLIRFGFSSWFESLGWVYSRSPHTQSPKTKGIYLAHDTSHRQKGFELSCSRRRCCHRHLQRSTAFDDADDATWRHSDESVVVAYVTVSVTRF